MGKTKIQSSIETAILGTYEGECADANITNANGLDITRPVWENVFNSDEYKKALKNGWYIGFLGHPEDPNCMDFEHACIKMTDGYIDDNGKVYGTFDLVDTPVGRVVAAFQKAGVTFGISVRGAGDIEDNSVDPDTFIFRGFDLVTFPAYPEAIPTFKEIAASTNLETQAKYKTVCKAVNENISGFNTVESIEAVQPFFANQSEEYAKLQKQKEKILSASTLDISEDKLKAMTALYASERAKTARLESQVKLLRKRIAASEKDFRRKLQSVERITASQLQQVDEQLAITASESSKLRAKNRKLILAHTKLTETNKSLSAINASLKSKNLKYNQEITANTQVVSDNRAEISDLQAQLRETVTDKVRVERQASNLGDKVAKLQAEVKAANQLIEEYQNAYASIYASAVSANLDNITIAATTTVSELQDKISEAACTSATDEYIEDDDTLDIDTFDVGNSDELVVL